MDGFTSRPLLPSDAPALLEMELAAERAEPSENFVDLTRIQEDLAMPGLDLANGSVAYLSAGVIVAAGFLVDRPGSGTWHGNLFGGVLPDLRRRGLGRAMLANLTDKAIALRERSGLSGDLQMWVPDGRASATGFATAAGFTTRRYFVEMRADLTNVPFMPQPEGILIRPWNNADDEGTRLAYNAAFADHWGSTPMGRDRWQTSFSGSAFFRADFSRVAVADGEIVGFVMVAEFPAKTAARGYRTGYVDRVGSLRSVRGRGVAAAMIVDSMRAQAESGCRFAELTVDADSPTGAGRIYERLGYAARHTNVVLGLDF